MLDEISAAVLFLTRLVSRNGSQMDSKKLAKFGARLSTLLVERFDGHWFPDRPCRGQGYRCIRVNEYGREDPLLERAARDSGLSYEDLRLPVELTIWIDPEEVCCRFGEHKGSYCTVATFKVNENNCKPSVFSDDSQSGDKPSCLVTSFKTNFQKKTVELSNGHQNKVHQLPVQHTSNQEALAFNGRAPVQFHYQHDQYQGVTSSDSQMNYCYLVPQVTRESAKRPVFSSEVCPSGVFDPDQSYRRLDYTSFPLVVSSAFDTQVSYSLHNDRHRWIRRYHVHT